MDILDTAKVLLKQNSNSNSTVKSIQSFLAKQNQMTCNKGQLNSEWIYDVIVSPKMPTKNFKDFCPGSLLEGRAEILKIFGWHFGRNDDLINSFWI